jgi:hypothetical protein
LPWVAKGSGQQKYEKEKDLYGGHPHELILVNKREIGIAIFLLPQGYLREFRHEQKPCP